MEVKVQEGIDDSINSKIQLFHEKTKDGIVLFETDKYPKFLNSNYDPLILNLVNCSFLIKNKITTFYDLIEHFVEYNQVKNLYEMEELKDSELKTNLINHKSLSELNLFEILPINNQSNHKDLLINLGANFENLPVKDIEILSLKNYNTKINKKFDITFSNNLMTDNSGIEAEKRSNVYRALEMYAILANLTKKNGYSVHCHGIYISSLYDTFFQFLGFKVLNYYRIESGPYNFGIIMKKFNEKQIDEEEFQNLYLEMKKRNPLRFR